MSNMETAYANVRQDVDYVKQTIDSSVNVTLIDANGNAVTAKVLQSVTGDSCMTEISYWDPANNMMSTAKVHTTQIDQSASIWQPTNISFVLPNGESASLTIMADQATLEALGTVFRSEPCEVCEDGESTIKYFLTDGGAVNPEGN